ncbi:MAG: beta-ketoacyl-ACP synthase III [Phycisphaeraceae bacterium]|nr:beta-ketoacyl-ACP synthase III [Phycisphaeraceae bacterium]
MTEPTPGGEASGVRIAGTGMAIPERVLTNDDLSEMVDTNDQWIRQRTGIEQRHIADDDTGAIDLGRDAVRAALDQAGIDPQQLDLLICATLTAEMSCPSSAARIVAELGATPAGAVDISAACSGFVYGMNMASALIASGQQETVAVVGVEVLSRITNWEDRRTCVLFGDGAGAAILTKDPEGTSGSLYQTNHSDGGKWAELYVPRREEDLPDNRTTYSGKLNTLQMNGREVYKFAVTTLKSCIDQALEENNLTPDDLAMVIPHQSNARILESARDRLGLPEDKFCINIQRYGNTSAASVPICLHELMDEGRLNPGDLVLFVALGGGMTWASNLWRL